MRRIGRTLVLVSAAVLAGSASAARPDISRYTLTTNDLPTGLGLHALHPHHLSVAQVARGVMYASFGFDNEGGYQLILGAMKLDRHVDGYVAHFLAGAPTRQSTGQSYVASQVTVYHDPTGAQAVARLNDLMNRANDFHCHSLAGRDAVGTDTVYCSRTAIAPGHKVEYFSIAWRQGRLRGAVFLTGRRGVFHANEVVSLARLQEGRMKTP